MGKGQTERGDVNEGTFSFDDTKKWQPKRYKYDIMQKIFSQKRLLQK